MSGMAITIVALVVLLLVLVIVMNVIQQQKERKEAERRMEIARQKAIIDETEEVILLSGKVPMSSDIQAMLLNRVIKSLQAWDEVASSSDIQQRIKDTSIQLSELTHKYPDISEQGFQVPDNEKQALAIIQGLKKLRLILRAEHNKGAVNPTVFVNEEKRIDRLLLKINLDNLISRATSSLLTQQLGSARQLVDKAEQIIAGIVAPDDYLKGRIEKVEEMRLKLREQARKADEEHKAKVQKPKEDDEFKQKKW